jgi:hypothetical protein
MENLSQNKKISLGLGVVVLISLFLPWFSFMIFSTSLIGAPGLITDLASFGGGIMDDVPFKIQLAIYMGYAFFILGAAGLYFNYKNDIQKAKLSYYAMVGYFALVIILNISDFSSFFGGGMDDIPFKIQLAIYIGYAFFILGAIGLYFNYKDDIQKAKLSYYAMVGYFALVIILNISDMEDMGGGDDGPSIFKFLGMGFYVFIASYIGNLKYLKEESESEIIEE